MPKYVDVAPYKGMCIMKPITVAIEGAPHTKCGSYLVEQFAKIEYVDDIPTADVQEVVHAYWITDFSSDRLLCSHCKQGRKHQASLHGTYKHLPPFPIYCENCGAKMDSDKKKCQKES